MPRNYGERTLVTVAITSGGVNINYGFLSGLRESLRSNFGQVVTTTSLPTNFCFGANSPKPGRASKKLATGIVSSFYADAKRSELKKAGYDVTRKKIRAIQTGGLAPVYFVTIGGIKYAWNMAYMSEQTLPSDLVTAAGVTKAENDEKGLVFGAEFPKPPRYTREVTINGNAERFTSFVDPEKIKSASEEWQPVVPAKFYPI